jgi:hypothetical protein
VVVAGSSGLLNAYRSVVSILGSAAVSGASLWLDALPERGLKDETITPKTKPRASDAATAVLKRGRAADVASIIQSLLLEGDPF